MTSWPALVDAHAGLVWQTIRRLLTHESDAADCFQETFLAAFEAHRSGPVRHWPAYLIQVATHQAIDRLRRRTREQRHIDFVPDFNGIAGTSAPPPALAEERELAERLRRAVAALPEDQAAVFWMTSFEPLSRAEIAAALGLTANHVGVLLHRARRALDTALGPTAASPSPDSLSTAEELTR